MSTPITWNGVVYTVPAFGDTGYAQGSGNLSSYLIALAGGPYPFTSQTVNPATAGTIRLAKTDFIDWRNNANSANLPLGINGSDQLTFNGATVISGSPVSVSNGGTGDTSLAAYSILAGGTTSTNPVQTVSGTGLSGQALVSNGAAALPTWQNVSGSGTVNSGTVGDLTLYPSTGTTVGDTYTQNGHPIKVNINPQGARTTSLTYNIQNPGNAITSTTLVMTDGDQIIGGNDIFTGNIQFDGLFNVNNATVQIGSAGTPGSITLSDNTGTAFINLSSPATLVGAGYVINLPAADGAANTVLQNHGNGSTSWEMPFPLLSADPGSPVEGQVWYNTTTHLWKGYNGSAVRTFTTT